MSSFAQVSVDPAQLPSGVSDGGSESPSELVDTGRYTVRAKPIPKSSLDKKKPPIKAVKPFVKPKPAVVAKAKPVADPVLDTPDSGRLLQKEDEARPGVADQVKDLVLGSGKLIHDYRQELDPEDIRRNLMEIRLASMLIYNESQSPFWYRDYNTTTPGFLAEARVWFTPLFGLNASYRSTVGGSMNSSVDKTKYSAFTDNSLRFGFRFRRFFGQTPVSPNFSLEVGFEDYKKNPPTDDDGRVRLQSSGPYILASARLPSSKKYAWIYEFELHPFPTHNEVSTGINVKSGTKVNSYGVGFGLGGEFTLSRSNRLYWKVSDYLERNNFGGETNVNDPITGSMLEGVPVTNNFIFLEIGLIWGH